MVAKKIEEIAKKYVEAVRARHINVEKAFLFGSYAKNKANKWSDIDIAIISPDFGKGGYLNESLLLMEIRREVNSLISPEPYSVEEYNKAKKGDFLYYEILRKGKLITN